MQNSRTSSHLPAPVVAGVDASEASWAAVLVGAWEAGQRRTSLLLVHGHYEPVAYPGSLMVWYPHDQARGAASAMLAACADRVRQLYPELTVHTKLVVGSGAGVLVDESRAACLVVVAARGSGGFAGLSIGSVGAQVSAHAHCPVIVVRPVTDDMVVSVDDIPRPGPVVVGVDGSAHSAAALAFAFEEATLRRVPVVAVFAWWLLPSHNLGPVYPGTYDGDEATAEARRILSETLAGWSPKYPDVELDQRPIHSMNPSLELIRASEHAGLVVVGNRGLGGFAGLLLGSVGRDLVGHAHAPVAVVPSER